MTRNCSTCGTPIAEGSRFCGRCGAPAPIDDPAEVAAATTPDPGSPDPTLISTPPAADSYAAAPLEPQRPRAGRRIAVIAAIVAGVAALGVAGGILLRSGGGGAGADTPDAAVRRLVAAVTDRDVLGAFEATAPDELRGAGDIYKASVDKARSLGMLEKSGDPLGGLTVSVSGLDLDVTTINEDLARVTVNAGTMSYKVDPAGFPVGDKYKEDFEASVRETDPSELEGTVDLAEDTGDGPPVLYTVRRGGRWYVSMYSTITHYLGFDPATTALDPNRAAAATPEEALTDLMEGAARLDPDAVLDAIAPAEARIARIYENIIREAFENARSSGATATVSSPSLETDAIDGNRAKVWINRVAVDVTMPEQGSVRVELEGTCATMRSGEESERVCLSDAGIDQYLHLLPSRAFVVAVKDDKGWYVSTVETMFELIRHTISAVKQSDIDALMNALSSGNFE